MNKEEAKNKVMEIMRLCFDITNTTDHDAFCSYSGHTNQIDACVHETDLKGAKERVYLETVYFFSDWYDTERGIENMIAELNKYLEKE